MAKEFLGRSTQRILDEIARSFGPDALIVSSADRIPSAAGTREGRLLGVTACRSEEVFAAGAGAVRGGLGGWFGELAAHDGATPASEPDGSRSTGLRDAHARLRRSGFPESLARSLVTDALERLGVDDLAEDEKIIEAIAAAAAARCPSAATLAPAAGRPLRVALVGPSGSGKSRAVARLAAQAAGLAPRVRVGAYGTGAAGLDRLGALPEVLGIPVSEVRSAREVKSLAKGIGSGVLLLDTAGVGTGAASGIDRLVEFLVEAAVDETHLVLPAAIDPNEANDLLAALSAAPALRLLVTKADETRAVGRVVALILAGGAPASYVSIGRDAVDDLIPAGPAAVGALSRSALSLAARQPDAALGDTA